MLRREELLDWKHEDRDAKLTVEVGAINAAS